MREASFLQSPFGAALAAVIKLELEEVGQVVTVGQAVSCGLVGEIAESGPYRGQLEFLGLGVDEGIHRSVQLLHDRPPSSSRS